MLVSQYFLLAALLISLIAAITDWRTGEIPNWLTLGPLAIAPLAQAAVAVVMAGAKVAGLEFGASLLGALLCGIAPALLVITGGGFAGDLKLLMAIGAILGPMKGLEAEMYSFLAACVFSLGRMAYEGKLLKTLSNTLFLAINPFLPKQRRRVLSPEMMSMIRFGPAAFVGVGVTVALHWWGA